MLECKPTRIGWPLLNQCKRVLASCRQCSFLTTSEPNETCNRQSGFSLACAVQKRNASFCGQRFPSATACFVAHVVVHTISCGFLHVVHHTSCWAGSTAYHKQARNTSALNIQGGWSNSICWDPSANLPVASERLT